MKVNTVVGDSLKWKRKFIFRNPCIAEKNLYNSYWVHYWLLKKKIIKELCQDSFDILHLQAIYVGLCTSRSSDCYTPISDTRSCVLTKQRCGISLWNLLYKHSMARAHVATPKMSQPPDIKNILIEYTAIFRYARGSLRVVVDRQCFQTASSV